MTNFTDKECMLNAEDTGSMENLFEIRRYQIDIDNEKVKNLHNGKKKNIFKSFSATRDIPSLLVGRFIYFATQAFHSSWENNAAEAQPYYNQFDFPKVNPDYYGR